MPPTGDSPQATIRYLTQIIACLAQKAGGTLRISKGAMRKINEESFRLFEDCDNKKDEIVLRFDSKHLWICAIEAECPASQSRPELLPSVQHVKPANGKSANGHVPTIPAEVRTTGSRLPFTDAQLAAMERRLVAEKTLRAIRRERSPTV